jgi:predicted nucleic acid-binding protein
MSVLVDSSVWIDYFKSGEYSKELDFLIDENLICINDLILTELVPPLRIKKESKLISLLYKIAKIALDINWSRILDYQIICLSRGINRVGIPDLNILDNVIKNDLVLLSSDKHFKLIREHIEFEIWGN